MNTSLTLALVLALASPALAGNGVPQPGNETPPAERTRIDPNPQPGGVFYFVTAGGVGGHGGTRPPAVSEIRHPERVEHPAPTDAGGGTSGGVGTVPGNGPAAPVAVPAKSKAKPGETVSNEDGVVVVNDPDSKGTATLSPAEGTAPDPESKVKTTTKFKGTISGIDGNDTVTLGSSNTVTVNGDGGNISMKGGTKLTVNNGTGGGNMYVNIASGATMIVAPGSSVIFIN